MKNIFQKLSIVSMFLVASCGSDNQTADDGVYFQDFDNLKMWGRDEWNLNSEIAHSGDFSAKTDTNMEYSQTFEMDYGYAKSKGYKAMQVTAWLYVTNMNAKASLVSSIESSAGSSAYETADIKNFITAPNHWEKISTFLKFPEKVMEGSRLKVYLWSPNKAKIYVDDVTVKLAK